MTKNNSNKKENIEAQLFRAADKLRKNIDAAEYKHIVLGLIFLKYISDSFDELHIKLKQGKEKYEGGQILKIEMNTKRKMFSGYPKMLAGLILTHTQNFRPLVKTWMKQWR